MTTRIIFYPPPPKKILLQAKLSFRKRQQAQMLRANSAIIIKRAYSLYPWCENLWSDWIPIYLLIIGLLTGASNRWDDTIISGGRTRMCPALRHYPGSCLERVINIMKTRSEDENPQWGQPGLEPRLCIRRPQTRSRRPQELNLGPYTH
jgi:hypothetical protein